MLSEIQTRKHTFIFDLIDFDGNGFIEKNDFAGIAENLCVVRGEEVDTPQSNQILAQCEQLWKGLETHIDENNDGKCTLEEWLKFIETNLSNGSSDKVNELLNSAVGQLFDLYDTDSNGDISLPEYLDIFLSFNLNASLVGKSFLLLDANGDGSISKNELLTFIKELLTSSEINDTGNWIFGDVFGRK
jgi:Ca2+-binding EF-hand superfamily protein